jgi:hypothetical protein
LASSIDKQIKRKRETRKCNIWQWIWFKFTSEGVNIHRQEQKLKDVQQAIRLLQCENMLKQKVTQLCEDVAQQATVIAISR